MAVTSKLSAKLERLSIVLSEKTKRELDKFIEDLIRISEREKARAEARGLDADRLELIFDRWFFEMDELSVLFKELFEKMLDIADDMRKAGY